MTSQQQLNDAVLYALKVGCFFPVPMPKPPYRTTEMIQWGAMRNLHSAIAAFHRESPVPAPKGQEEK